MNTQDRDLNTADLFVGQDLILLKVRPNRWGNGPTEYHEVEVRVAKVLKNRLVIETLDGKTSWRLIVEYSQKYTYANGRVTTELEGSRSRDSRFYTTPEWYKTLYTPDDPKLAEKKAQLDAQNVARAAERDAREALDAFKKSLSVEDAEATIKALQAFIASKEN